jgi:spore coat protein U-like protein
MNTIRWQWLAAALLLSNTVAMAGSATGALAVSATVSPTCAVTTSPVNFGAYHPAAKAPTDATGLLVITCTEGVFFDIALDAGAYPSIPGDAATRRMTRIERGRSLPYALFADSVRTTLWGSAYNTTQRFFTHAGNGAAHDYPVYGRIDAGQYVPAGLYADTVIATLTYH